MVNMLIWRYTIVCWTNWEYMYSLVGAWNSPYSPCPLTELLSLSLQAYSNLLRAHIDGLKKKDKKSKSKKTKATQWDWLNHSLGHMQWSVLPEWRGVGLYLLHTHTQLNPGHPRPQDYGSHHVIVYIVTCLISAPSITWLLLNIKPEGFSLHLGRCMLISWN